MGLDEVVDLPPGLTEQPLALTDAAAVARVIAAQERADTGGVHVEEADIVGDWQRPSFDVATSTVGIFAGDALVAYAEVSGGDRGDAAVHPDHRGRGLGTALAGWMQSVARAQGAAAVGMPVPVGSPGEVLLRSLGYRERWTSWTLVLPAGAQIPGRALPQGYAVRVAAVAERPALHAVLEDAFLEWSQRRRETFDDFAARTVRRPGFVPDLLRVVVDPGGEIVGGVVLVLADRGDDGVDGYVERVAVRRDRRGRGLAQALLADAFATARSLGADRAVLDTDSRTGAVGLYERVGMVVDSTWVNLAKELA